MKIEMNEILVSEVYQGYKDSAENGVVAFGGALNVRPAFQREFVYKDRQRDEVIKTVRKNFPLNVFYWAKNGESDFEMLDGQQRTISICQFINGDYSIDYQYFHNLTSPEQKQIMDYKLMVYICEGDDKEKLDWFKIINIAGEQLSDQELRNAIYTGTWLTDAKKYFSKNGCPAYAIGEDYISGKLNRQEYLETALKWISSKDNQAIEDYMAKHQNDGSAIELWLYFQSVINWVKAVFSTYRGEMKSVNWGELYNKHHLKHYDPNKLEIEVARLMQDEDVSNRSGIYPYVLNRNEKHLNIRAFSKNMRREAFERQLGVCPTCGQTFLIDEMEADHITPWHLGGKTNADNCQMLCKGCNRTKSGV